MEFSAVLAQRKMVRDFDPDRPVEPELLDSMLGQALRSPSAGNSQGTHFVVLTGAETARFWDASLPGEARGNFAFPGLLAAPVLVVAVAEPGAYLSRYSEPDKASALGKSISAWPVPYWLTDTAFATMALLLKAVDEGLGACFFGLFDRTEAVSDALAIPADAQPLGVVALGYGAAGKHRPGRSSTRARRDPAEVIHRGRW